MRRDEVSAWSRAMRFFSTSDNLEKIGAKVESLTIPALNETKGDVFEWSPTTDNIRFEIMCIGITSKSKDMKPLFQTEKTEKSSSIHIEFFEYTDANYKAKIEWDMTHTTGVINIWINRRNSLFNILSLLVKCKDRIHKDFIVHASSVSTFEANLPWLIEVIQQRPLLPAENKYEDLALLALLFSINKMSDDEYTRWFYKLIYSIWLFASICFNHISDDLAVIALAESKDIIGVKFIFKNTYFEKKNIFDLINEVRSNSKDKKLGKKTDANFDEDKVFAIEGWKLSEP